jgi:hypothetical protein
VVSHVKALMNRGPFKGHCRLVADGTGVGRAVVDLLNDACLSPTAVQITGGNAETHEHGTYNAPKRDLVAVLQVALQSVRLKVADGLPEASTLVRELLNYRVKITQSANSTYGCWREGERDDLLLAVALAV